MSMLVCAWLVLALAACGGALISPQASAWGTELVLTVTPTEFYQDTSSNVTVVVRDMAGNPVDGASVYFYTRDMSAYSSSNIPMLHESPGVSLGLTDATGTFTTTYTPEYSDPHHLFIQARNGTTQMGWVEFELEEGPGDSSDPLGWLGDIGNSIGDFFGAVGDWIRRYGLLLGSTMLVPVTAYIWRRSVRTASGSSFSGFHKVFGDDNVSAGKMGHLDGKEVFHMWKAALAGSKEAKLFMSSKLLNSFELKGSKKHYAGLVRAEEEVEYFKIDKVDLRMNDPFKLHADPKPIPPDDFTTEDDVQAFPVSERPTGCQNCLSTGEVKCAACKGRGTKDCQKCMGRGYNIQIKGGGYEQTSYGGAASATRVHDRSTGVTSSYTTQYSSPNVSSKSTTISSNKCYHCDGTGQVPCPDCRNGKVTCKDCGGHKYLREVTRRVWTYKHEIHSEVFGPEGSDLGESKFNDIEDSAEDMGGALEGAKIPEGATPEIMEIIEKARQSHGKWVNRSKGKVVKEKHRVLVSPLVECEVQYQSKDGPSTFRVWGLGNAKAWVLDAWETPTDRTARYLARHAVFGILIVLEVVAVLFLADMLPVPF